MHKLLPSSQVRDVKHGYLLLQFDFKKQPPGTTELMGLCRICSTCPCDEHFEVHMSHHYSQNISN